MLGNRGESLVQHEFEGVVVRSDDEVPTPQIGMPMADGLDQPNQLAFIGSKLEIARRKRSAEEGKCAVALMKHSPEAGAGRIAINHERLGEVR